MKRDSGTLFSVFLVANKHRHVFYHKLVNCVGVPVSPLSFGRLFIFTFFLLGLPATFPAFLSWETSLSLLNLDVSSISFSGTWSLALKKVLFYMKGVYSEHCPEQNSHFVFHPFPFLSSCLGNTFP